MPFKDTGEECFVCWAPLVYLRSLDVWTCTRCKVKNRFGEDVPVIRLTYVHPLMAEKQ